MTPKRGMVRIWVFVLRKNQLLLVPARNGIVPLHDGLAHARSLTKVGVHVHYADPKHEGL